MTKITNQSPRLTSKVPQRINTAPNSSHSVEQSSSLNLPTTTTSIYESATNLTFSVKMITKQELSIINTLPRKNNKTLMQIQPTGTTQRSLTTSHPNNIKGNAIRFQFVIPLRQRYVPLAIVGTAGEKSKK